MPSPYKNMLGTIAVYRGSKHIHDLESLDSLGSHCLGRERQTVESLLKIPSTNRVIGMNLWECSGRSY